jgi:hypothetical protein
MMQMHYFALIQRIAAQVPLEAATGRDSRRMDVLRTAVSKLINTYISGTLFAVFRNPTFMKQCHNYIGFVLMARLWPDQVALLLLAGSGRSPAARA